jgi:hypothetical protein
MTLDDLLKYKQTTLLLDIIYVAAVRARNAGKNLPIAFL